jgi:hypothetical protein
MIAMIAEASLEDLLKLNRFLLDEIKGRRAVEDRRALTSLRPGQRVRYAGDRHSQGLIPHPERGGRQGAQEDQGPGDL